MGPVNLVNRPRRFKTALLLALSLVLVLAMKTGVAQEGGGGPLSVPDDWTSRHVIFSGARSEAAAEKLASEPRYLHQWLKHNRPLRRGDRPRESNGRFAAPVAGDQLAAPAVAETYPVPGLTSLYLAAERAAARRPRPQPQPAASGLKQDWASELPAGATVGAGMYPAKFTFDVAAAPDCDNDYVAFNTGFGNATAASRAGTFTGTPAANQTVTIGGTLVLTASTSSNGGLNFDISGMGYTNTTRATNLAAAIARNGASVGVTATSSGAVVTVTATSPGSGGNSITLAEGLSYFTWASGTPTTLAGGAESTAPSIVAYNNLYSTQSATLQGYCPGNGPSVRWAYSTGTGSVLTSPGPVTGWQEDPLRRDQGQRCGAPHPAVEGRRRGDHCESRDSHDRDELGELRRGRLVRGQPPVQRQPASDEIGAFLRLCQRRSVRRRQRGRLAQVHARAVGHAGGGDDGRVARDGGRRICPERSRHGSRHEQGVPDGLERHEQQDLLCNHYTWSGVHGRCGRGHLRPGYHRQLNSARVCI